MRRYAIAGTLLALSCLLAPTGLPRGACDSPRPRSTRSAAEGECGCAGATSAGTAVKPAGKVRPVTELAAILDRTDSKDTFLLTVMVLRKIGPQAREALPAIIRNAERLGMVKGLAKALACKAKGEADTKVSAATEEICDAVLEIASATKAGKREPNPPVACYAPTPSQPAQVVPAQPAVPPPAPSVNPPSVAPAPTAPAPSYSAPTVPLAR